MPRCLVLRMRRYLLSHHGEQIAEFVEVESGKRSDRPQLQAAMALAKKRKASLLVAKTRPLEPQRRVHRHADGQQGL
jgi:DNA invertase Pin-like site-specific DNA recombinase